MNNNSQLDLVLAMFNQYLFQDAKSNINEIRYYFQSNPNTAGNPLISELVDAIRDYSLENIGLPLFQGILAKTSKTPNESTEILNKIIQYKTYSKDQIEPSKKYLKDIVAQVYVERANKACGGSPSDFVSYIKKLDFKSNCTDYLNSTSFNKIDINSVVADQASAIITSSFGFINDSFTEGAYKAGDIIVVSAPPSVGKSLIVEAEALHMAIHHQVNVNLLVMGDLDMSSLFIRLAAIYTGQPFREVREHISQIYDEMKRVLGDRLDIIVAPAGVIRADEYVQYILNSPKKYKAVFADYDENFAKSGNSDSGMYEEFGNLYNEFTKLKEAGIISEICCQPKQFTWSDPNVIITLENLGTSSRKGHIADVVITCGKEPNCLNGLVQFYIAKNRHGSNRVAHAIRLKNGRFKIIPKEVYNDIKGIPEQRDFSEGDIDMMIDAYRRTKQSITNQVQDKMNNTRPTLTNSPF